MADRYTRKDVDTLFARYVVQALGGRVATNWDDVGGYLLDYYALGGGYRIERVHSASGGRSTPLVGRRYRATAFADLLTFALATRDERQRLTERGETCEGWVNGALATVSTT